LKLKSYLNSFQIKVYINLIFHRGKVKTLVRTEHFFLQGHLGVFKVEKKDIFRIILQLNNKTLDL